MRFKQILAGGSTEDLTRSEIDTLLRAMDTVDDTMVRLTPFTKVLFAGGNMTATDDEWKQSFQAFVSAAVEISSLLSAANQTYGITELRDLVLRGPIK